MTTKHQRPDPLGIIGKFIIIPTRVGIGTVESYCIDIEGGYYVIVFFDGISKFGALERNFVSPEFITDAIGVQILGGSDENISTE